MKFFGKHVLKKAPLHKVVAIEHVKTGKTQTNPKKHSEHSKYTRLGLGVVTGFIVGLGILLLVSLRYSFVSVSLVGHKINQNTDTNMLKSAIEEESNSYKLIITSPKSNKSFSLNKTGVTIDVENSIKNAIETKKPKNLFRRLAFWNKYEVPLDLTTDQKSLEKFLATELSKTIIKPRNAAIKITEGNAVVVSEKDGKSYTVADPSATLLGYISKLDESPILLKTTVTPAKVTTKEAEIAKKTVDEYLKREVSFDIAGTQIVATPADIGKWLEVSPVSQNKTIDVVINSGKILDYLDSIAAPYVSPPQNAIVLPGSTKILIPGRNGVDIVNKESLATEIAKQMLSQTAINQTLSVQYQTYKTVTATPHDKWIAVDLTSKVLYAYENTKLVNTFLISAGAPGTPTVEGTYKIYSKLASQDMAGPNADGTRYFQPAVPYVNYFYADYAIHGVYWRPDSYLGSINASHGCVGMNVGQAGWLYGWSPIGTTVITFS